MKVFVTGSTGFIGSYLFPELQKGGHIPVCLVWSGEERPPEWMIRLVVPWVSGDIGDHKRLAEMMRGCDALVHLAGLYSTWEADHNRYHEINVLGTRNVMLAALEAGISKVINVSTYAVWGGTYDRPFTELSTPGKQPASEYARTKYAVELEAWKLYREKNLPLIVIYPCNVLGAGDTRPTGEYVRDMIEARLPALMFVNSTLTFVHVRDVAQGILRALEKPDNLGEKYILGNERITVKDFNVMVAECGQVKTPHFALPNLLAMFSAGLLTATANLTWRPPLWGLSLDQARSLEQGLSADGSKAERELGLVYTPVCQAVEETVAWMRDGSARAIEAASH